MGRAFHHQGAVLQIEPCHCIDRLRVRREEERLRVHERLEDADRAVDRADVAEPVPDGHERRARHGVQEHLHAVPAASPTSL